MPLRTLYLLLTVLIAFVSYILLVALGSPFAPATAAPDQSRPSTVRITPLYGSTPIRYARQIAAMPAARSVHYLNFTAGPCNATGKAATLNAVGAIGGSPSPDAVQRAVSAGEFETWLGQRNGVLVGRALAEACGWHPGSLLTLPVMGLSAPIELQIVAIYHSADAPGANHVAYVHFDYFDSLESPDSRGKVLTMSAQATTPHAAPRLAAKINARFATASPPLEAHLNTVIQGAWAKFGNVLAGIRLVIAAVFLCALLVLTNTAAHAAAERRNQFALFLALGFSRANLVGLVTGELLVVAIIGCALGLGAGWALLHWVVAPLLPSMIYSSVAVPKAAVYIVPAILAGMVSVAALIPGWETQRVRAATLSNP